MAVLGRRQPHAPLILRGGQNQPSTARVLVVGQKTSQYAADRYFRRSFPPKIIKAGGQPSVSRLLIVSDALRRAADRFYRRSFPPIIKQAGGIRSMARLLVVQAQHARRPARRPVLISQAPPPVVAVTAPVAVTLVVGQKTSQHAAHRYFRRLLTPIINRAGGRPAVSRFLVVSQAVRTAADRYFRRQFPPLIVRAGGQPAVGRLLVVSDTRRRATDRLHWRQFPPLINRAGGQPAVGRVTMVSQAVRTAWDRYYRRQFQPLIIRAGGQPAVARLLLVKAQPAWRPVRHPVLMLTMLPTRPGPHGLKFPVIGGVIGQRCGVIATTMWSV